MIKKFLTIRQYVLVIIFAGLLTAGAAGPGSAPALAADNNAVIHPDPLSVGMRSGQETEISIRVDRVKNLYGIEFLLKFDPKIVQVQDADDSQEGTQIAVGDWLDGGFVAANKVDNAKGTIVFAATLLNPAPPLSGDGTAATIVFRARADGNSPLKISKALLATRDATEIKSTVQDGAIGVSVLAQAPVIQNGNKSSNQTNNDNNSSASALPGTPTLVLLAAAGTGVLAVVISVVVLFGIILLRRRT